MTKTELRKLNKGELETVAADNEIEFEGLNKADLLAVLLDELFKDEDCGSDDGEDAKTEVELVRMFRWRDGVKQFADVHPGMVEDYMLGDYIEVE